MAQTTISASREKAIAQALAYINQNEWPKAESLLEPLLLTDDADALQLLGVLRRAQGRLSEAEELYRRSLAIAPDQAHVHHNLGSLLSAAGHPNEALDELREAIRLRPSFAEAHLSLALVWSSLGEHAAAEKSCRDALRRQPNYLLAKQCLATELCALDRPQEAERLLRQTLALGVRDARQAAALEHNLAMALKQQNQFHEALKLFDSAQAKVPDMPAVDFNRGSTFQQLGLLEQAAFAYRRAAKRDPENADAYACLALILVQTNDFAGAREAGLAATARAPDQAIALIALAVTDIEDGKIDDATRLLETVLALAEGDTTGQTSFALGFAADAFDRRGYPHRAFVLHAASNARRRSLLRSALGGTRVTADVARLIEYFRDCAPWPPSSTPPRRPLAAAQHVFLLGFMRSGTTLLETVLVSNPHVIGMDEIEFLTEPARAFLLSGDGLDRLAALNQPDAEKWRAAYWKAVSEAGLAVGGKAFIDKMPFNSLRLPLIGRLFPNAKVLFAIRDPRDVVLSCFRRRFSPTAYSYEFLSLEDCACFYDQTMTLSELYREKLPLDLRPHRYEDIVRDFDSEIRSICEFIGVEWSPAMRDFGGVARAVDRRSASAAQVRRGLYDGAAGQWRNYAAELAPILPIIRPWIEKFGYPRD